MKKFAMTSSHWGRNENMRIEFARGVMIDIGPNAEDIGIVVQPPRAFLIDVWRAQKQLNTELGAQVNIAREPRAEQAAMAEGQEP